MGKQENERLQRYFDDELGQQERAEFEATVTDADKKRLEALGELRGLIGGALEANAAHVDLWPGIERQLTGRSSARPVRRWMPLTSASVFAAAAAVFLFVFHPWHLRHATNECDVETLEVEGGTAAIFKVNDLPHHGDGTTTIIWVQEE